MTEQLSDREKALLILEKAKNSLDECGKQLRETQTAFMELTSAVENANDKMTVGRLMEALEMADKGQYVVLSIFDGKISLPLTSVDIYNIPYSDHIVLKGD